MDLHLSAFAWVLRFKEDGGNDRSRRWGKGLELDGLIGWLKPANEIQVSNFHLDRYIVFFVCFRKGKGEKETGYVVKDVRRLGFMYE